MSHDDGVYRCGEPGCDVCVLFERPGPGWRERVRETLVPRPFVARQP